MIELMLFALAGVATGIIFGLIPGLHPNTMIVFMPLMASLEPFGAVVFLVCLGISNILTDFVPSILLGAPDAGSELAVLPGQKLMMEGNGYSAIRFMVIGFISSLILFMAALPLMIAAVPAIFEASQHVVFALLVFVSCIMILSERRVVAAALVFCLAGIIGLAIQNLQINQSLILFPVLAGLFGVSSLLIQIKSGSVIAKQNENYIPVDKKSAANSSLMGCCGGIVSGFLPGVGTSQVASFFTVRNDEKSFLITLGAIAASNFTMSLVAIWLIGKTRSGIAVAINNVYNLTINDSFTVVFSCLFAAGAAALFIIYSAKPLLRFMERINYSLAAAAVLIMIIVMVTVFTGLEGLMVMVTCASLGIYTLTSNLKRGLMMAVLIVPTAVFFAGF